MPGYLDALARRRLYEEFSSAGLKPQEHAGWIEAKSAELHVPVRTLREYLANEKEIELLQIREAGATDAQRVASIIGASATRAIGVLESALEAEKQLIFHNRDGEIVDERGVPHWEARIGAAKEILKIHGGFAPEKTETVQPNPDDPQYLTEAEIDERLAKLREEAARVSVAQGEADS